MELYSFDRLLHKFKLVMDYWQQHVSFSVKNQTEKISQGPMTDMHKSGKTWRFIKSFFLIRDFQQVFFKPQNFIKKIAFDIFFDNVFFLLKHF